MNVKWKLKNIYGQEFILCRGENSVGRGVNNTIVIQDYECVVSRNHARITVDNEDNVTLQDKSSNGTYVGRRQIPKDTTQPVFENDDIGFGWTQNLSVPPHHDLIFKLSKIIISNEPSDVIDLNSDSDDFNTQAANEAKVEPAKIEDNVVLATNHEEHGIPPVKEEQCSRASLCVDSGDGGVPSSNKENIESCENNGIVPLCSDSKKVNVSSIKKLKIDPCENDQIICINSEDIDEPPVKKQKTIPNENNNETPSVQCNAKVPLQDAHDQLYKVNKFDNNNVSTPSTSQVQNNEIKPLAEKQKTVIPNILMQDQVVPSSVKIILKDEAEGDENIMIKGEYDDYDDDEQNFSMKEEFLDEEPIQLDSDSEDDIWIMRLSQSSPGKPFIRKSMRDVEVTNENELQDEDLAAPLIDTVDAPLDAPIISNIMPEEDEEEFVDDIIRLPEIYDLMERPHDKKETMDSEDNHENIHANIMQPESMVGVIKDTAMVVSKGKGKTETRKAVMIEPLTVSPKTRVSHFQSKETRKGSGVEKRKKKYYIPSKTNMNQAQKEERNRRLKEIAQKAKSERDASSSKNSNQSSKQKVKAKYTHSNRGMFLTEDTTVKPTGRTDTHKEKKKSDEHKNNSRNSKSDKDLHHHDRNKKSEKNINSQSKHLSEKNKSAKHITVAINKCINDIHSNVKLPSMPSSPVAEISNNNQYQTAKPIKPKKSVRFSQLEPQIKYFEIEPGHQMKKTSLCKLAFLERQRALANPVSVEKRFLGKVLHWNPNWLNEQERMSHLPPLLGNDVKPMTMCHVFSNHEQYTQILTNLLLVETWGNLTQAYSLRKEKENWLRLTVESPPLDAPDGQQGVPQNFTVNLSLPKHDRRVPRVGEIMILYLDSEPVPMKKFVYIHNVRTLPSPPNNVNSFFTLSLYVLRMWPVRPGTTLNGNTLDSIRNELVLVEAIEELKSSPLGPGILNPQPEHFSKYTGTPHKSKWTTDLNDSQVVAVESSVSAALSGQPSIQMIQGPPGTGKSAVICSTVMRYLYTSEGRRQHGRGKLLICASSNTAVDELVIRLLKNRQEMPTEERFRMVRVGREESMHPRALNISSTTLAKRDVMASRQARKDPDQPGFSEEIAHLETKVNTYSASLDAARGGDPARVAFIQSKLEHYKQRLHQAETRSVTSEQSEQHTCRHFLPILKQPYNQLIHSRIAGSADEEFSSTMLSSAFRGVQVRSLTGNLTAEPSASEMNSAERRVIEGANIIVTTLSSAANHKLKCIKNRIELCIVDEAGQAIEPMSLIPLTLNVRKLTLIGDPKQLPGHTTSKWAKDLGLADSLFSRLTSTTEDWLDNPVIFLNEQYRMHPAISDYPNRAFYGGCVTDRTSGRRGSLPLPPYSMLFISSGDSGQGASGANEMEAWGVSRLVMEIAAIAQPLQMSVAVITPYNGHKAMILRCLSSLRKTSDPPIEVNTVDSFQGQERDIVVVSLARSHGVGFLYDLGRMNVMLTRAKHSLLVCLNPYAMNKNSQWRTLIEDAKSRKVVKYLPNSVCKPASLQETINNPVLKHVYSSSNS